MARQGSGQHRRISEKKQSQHKPASTSNSLSVFLYNIRVPVSVGACPQERKLKQMIQLDLELCIGDGKAGRTDRLSDTIDYAIVATTVKSHLTGGNYILLEPIVEEVADIILRRFEANTVRVLATKWDAVHCVAEVGVGINCHR